MNNTDLNTTMVEFSKLFDSISKVSASQVTLDPQTPASGLQGQPSQQAAEKLTSRVALSTPLTEDAVRPIVQAAMTAHGNDVQQV